jgi:hypothetical protein
LVISFGERIFGYAPQILRLTSLPTGVSSDVDAAGDSTYPINIVDIVWLAEYLFGGGLLPVPCLGVVR